ncbi:hypothetical protein Tco_0869810 [Tanacetum coccineum]
MLILYRGGKTGGLGEHGHRAKRERGARIGLWNKIVKSIGSVIVGVSNGVWIGNWDWMIPLRCRVVSQFASLKNQIEVKGMLELSMEFLMCFYVRFGDGVTNFFMQARQKWMA